MVARWPGGAGLAEAGLFRWLAGLWLALASVGLGAFTLSSPAIQLWSDGTFWSAGIYTGGGASLTYPMNPNYAGTSKWDVRVDASLGGGPGPAVYSLAQAGVVSAAKATGNGLGGYVQGTLQFGNYLQVDSQYKIVNNPQNGTGADTVEFKYVLRNVGPSRILASLRLLIDTMVNGVDGANLSVNNGASVVTNATTYRQRSGMPGNWWDYDVPPPGAAGLVGRGSLYGNPYGDPATEPAAFEVAYWQDVYAANDWAIDTPGNLIQDSAAVLWWTNGSDETGPGYNLAPGDSVTLVTYYGLNQGALLATFTPDRTATPSYTASPSFTDSPTVTDTPTATASPTPTATASPCPTASPTHSPSPTRTPCPTASPTRTASPCPTVSPTITPTFTHSPTSTATPIPLVLTPHFPNPDPAGPTGIWLPYTLSIPAAVQMRVYNVSGELVRHLNAGRQPPGDKEQHWDLRNDFGAAVSSGVYLVQLQADAQGQQTQVWEKCAVLR